MLPLKTEDEEEKLFFGFSDVKIRKKRNFGRAATFAEEGTVLFLCNYDPRMIFAMEQGDMIGTRLTIGHGLLGPMMHNP